jgi:hypothetical protein
VIVMASASEAGRGAFPGEPPCALVGALTPSPGAFGRAAVPVVVELAAPPPQPATSSAIAAAAHLRTASRLHSA